MAKLLSIFERIQKGIKAILGALLGIMMAVVFAQTFTRYVVFHSLPWSEELSRFLFVGIIVVGINLGISENMMVRIDIIDGFLGKNSAKIAEIIRQLIGLLTNAAFAYSTLDLIKIGSVQTSPSLHVPMSAMYTILLIGFVLACISVLVKIAELLTKSKEGA